MSTCNHGCAASLSLIWLALPNIFWFGVIVVLFSIALLHAKVRSRREQELWGTQHGWQFSDRSSPIDAADWQELGQNPALNGLLLAANRRNFYWGTHSGTAFVMFEARSLSSHNADVGAPQTMIAFRKAANLPTIPSTLSAGGTPWERYITDRWVFLRPPLPWIARGPEAKRVLEEAYVQFRGL
jgi:hypothetical protein